MLAAKDTIKWPEVIKNRPVTMPITEIPPNFCSLVANSIYTQPEISAQAAGRITLLNPGAIAALPKVAMVTSTKYSAVNTTMEIRSGTVSLWFS